MREVVSQYAAGKAAVTPQASWYRPAAVYRVRAQGSDFGVKRFRGTEAELKFVTTFLLHLEEKGFRFAPRLVRTLAGGTYFKKSGALYYATSWYDAGAPFDPQDKGQIQAAGRVLAGLHEAGRTFAGELPLRSTRGREGEILKKRHQDFQAQFAKMQQKRPESPFLSRLGQEMPLLLEEAEQALEALTGPDTAEYRTTEVWQTVCHGDVTRPNLLNVKKRRRMYLIDFDSIVHAMPLIDLDKWLSNCFAWDYERMERGLAAYHRESPLGEQALQLLAHLMNLPKEEWHLMRLFATMRMTKAREAELLQQFEQLMTTKAAKRAAIAKLRQVTLDKL